MSRDELESLAVSVVYSEKDLKSVKRMLGAEKFKDVMTFVKERYIAGVLRSKEIGGLSHYLSNLNKINEFTNDVGSHAFYDDVQNLMNSSLEKIMKEDKKKMNLDRVINEEDHQKYFKIVDIMGKLGKKLDVPKLPELGYKLLDWRKVDIGCEAIVAAYKNGEKIGEEIIRTSLKSMYNDKHNPKSKNMVDFTFALASLKKPLNLEMDVQGLFNEVGFGFSCLQRLDENSLKVYENLIKLEHGFDLKHFTQLLYNHLGELHEKYGSFHDTHFKKGLELLDSTGFVPDKKFVNDMKNKAYSRFSEKEDGGCYLIFSSYMNKYGFSVSKTNLRNISDKNFSESHYNTEIVKVINDLGYNSANDLSRWIMRSLRDGGDGVCGAHFEQLDELGGMFDEEEVTQIGCKYLLSDDIESGKEILKFVEKYSTDGIPALGKYSEKILQKGYEFLIKTDIHNGKYFIDLAEKLGADIDPAFKKLLKG